MVSAESTGNRGMPETHQRPVPPRAHDLIRLVAIGSVAIITLAVVAADWDSPVRAALTLAFLLFVPGLAFGELLEIDDPVRRLALAAGFSLALETLVATSLLYAGLFSPVAAVGITVALTCFALLGAAWRRSLSA